MPEATRDLDGIFDRIESSPRLLKGKSCFHVKQLGDGLMRSIDDALERGFELCRERGWV